MIILKIIAKNVANFSPNLLPHYFNSLMALININVYLNIIGINGLLISLY